jgi:xanthine phosphoribosyltransferase
MEELKNRILQDGLIIDNRILKVDNFLNQQIDPALVLNMGREFAKRFADCPIDRIVTIESSGIAIALAASLAMGNLPVVFARKKKSLLMQDAVYTASIYSYTKVCGQYQQILPARRRTRADHR